LVRVHLIEILLPVSGNDHRRFPEAKFSEVREELTSQFGGITAFTRAPAHGMYEDNGRVHHDDIIIMEVMTEVLDRDWWRSYRIKLEKEFAQDEIVIRAFPIEPL
jgi:hypothetical protein